MKLPEKAQAKMAAPVSSPLSADGGVTLVDPDHSEAMTTLVAKLAGLRTKYLDELRTAREKVKQNFLK